MTVLRSCDPGANPGHAVVVVNPETQVWSWTHDTAEADAWPEADEAVFEAQHSGASMYRNGKRVRIARKSQATLSFTAGRLFERVRAKRKYRMEPDAWRAVLWPGSRRLPKKVVLARLAAMPDAPDFSLTTIPKKNRPDVLEAWGILQAWLKLTSKQKEKYRVVS